MLKTIIFDFDGTLVDTRKAIVQAFWETIEACGFSPSKRPGNRGLITLPLESSFRNAGIQDQSSISRAMHTYDGLFQKIAAWSARPFPGVPETIRRISQTGLRRGIATNEVRENLELLLKSFGLFDMFEASICADEVANAKPATDMICYLLMKLNCEASETLVVGDSVLDLQMGKEAGCLTCAVTYGAHSRQMLSQGGPDWIIDGFSQLLEIEPVAEAMHLTEKKASV